MASLHTLVQDIEEILSSRKNVSPSEEDLETFAVNVKEALVSTFLRNNLPEERRNKLRMSNIGRPDRQLWYELNQKEEELQDLPYTLLIKFLYGSILEELLVLLCKTAGHSVTEQQREHNILGIKGHQDAKVDGVIVDFKSASGRGFLKFKDHSLLEDDPFGYIPQLSAYVQASGEKEAAFIAIDKQSGEIAVMPVHYMEMINAPERIKNLKTVLSSSDVPNRCYSDEPEGKSGNYKLSIGCVFCKFKKECWSDVNDGQGIRAFKYANGTKYLTRIANLPRVEEIPF